MHSHSESKPGQKTRQARLHLEHLESRLAPATVGNDVLWRTYTTAQAFNLHSNPTSTKKVYLDFNGQTVSGTGWNTSWNGGNAFTHLAWSIDTDRTTFSAVERDKIIKMWRMVAEDFAPFNVDVTTEDPGVAGLTYSGGSDTTWGVRAIIGPIPDSSVVSSPPSAGGIAYVGTFKNATDLPCFVWNGDSDPNPEGSLDITVSHEVGHTLGLGHDGGTADPNYYGGHGTGLVSWGPIMGAPFERSVTQWSMNTYPGATNSQDDLAVIASSGNGLGYRTDDYGNSTSGAKALNGIGQGTLNTLYGTIEQTTDFDVFSFKANAGAINIKIDSLKVPGQTAGQPAGANLDILAEVLSSSGGVIATNNPTANLDAAFTINLPANGTYYLRISGTGLAPFNTTGYPKYASLGSYRITGTVMTPSAPKNSVRVMNPTRWVYNYATGTYDGGVTVTNVTGAPLTGPIVFVFTLPPGVTFVPTAGWAASQAGSQLRITYYGTINANSAITIPFKLIKPSNVVLLTGYNSYFTDIAAV